MASILAQGVPYIPATAWGRRSNHGVRGFALRTALGMFGGCEVGSRNRIAGTVGCLFRSWEGSRDSRTSSRNSSTEMQHRRAAFAVADLSWVDKSVTALFTRRGFADAPGLPPGLDPIK